MSAIIPGVPKVSEWEVGYTVGLEPPIGFVYTKQRAENDLRRIAQSPDPVGEYCEIYRTRNHLR